MLLLKRLVLCLLLGSVLVTGLMYWNALADPVVRRDSIAVANWPQDMPSKRVLIVSDLHVAGPDMPPERVTRLVGQMNSLQPDLILFAGDFVSDKRVATHIYSGAEALKPLTALKAGYGKIAVLGNHDHWRSDTEIRSALEANGLIVLDNAAIAAGPFAVGGVDDDFTGRANVAQMLAAMRPLTGVPIVVSHSPDIVPELPDSVIMVAAGHTHCGQINLPGLDTIRAVSRFGARYACGRKVEGGKTIYISAGLGTSILPLRFRAPPDMWLVTMGPAKP